MKFLKYALLVLFAAGMMSCGGGGGGDDDEPEVDTTKPAVTISSPTATTIVDAGSNLPVSFTATDNVAVSSYTLTVAYSGAKSVKTVEEFAFNSASDSDADGNALPTITGTSSSVSFEIAIPDNAKPAMYKMSIVIKDSSNNTNTAKEVTFEIR
ncbi:DUF4625 domain-containing protein [Marinifilum sp. RC60d5]|uniref:DUF4625 domain-containing protein n=1 Tax=Marinifilum sp. RC60d5 TaxID=3458414 RepID=UPI004035A42B